jgi:hypothetical protein
MLAGENPKMNNPEVAAATEGRTILKWQLLQKAEQS